MSDTPQTDAQPMQVSEAELNSEATAYEATQHTVLRDQIIDARIPKNEREWWAAREIERLERDIYKAREERDKAISVAERLIEYAHECLVKLESWGQGYQRYEDDMERIREDIAAYNMMKETHHKLAPN